MFRTDDYEVAPRARAVKSVERLKESGAMIERIPPSEVVRVLTYTDLSDFLDAVIADMYKLRPEAFDNSQSNFMQPGPLKAYLYVVALDHFRAAGILTAQGAQDFPNTAGCHVPTTLLAWLSRIGDYLEGDQVGRARYAVPASTPIVGNVCLLTGAPTETAINTSTFLTAGVFTTSAAGGEAQAGTTTANGATVIANWQTVVDVYSAFLKNLDYPCAPMWEEAPPIPDGSFFAFPSSSSWDATPAVGNPYFASPFVKWDVDLASCYWSTASLAATAYYYPFIAPRCGPMSTACTSTGAVGGGSMDAFWFLKQCFCFIIRNNPALDLSYPTVSNMRRFHGDPLTTFLVRNQWFDFRGFSEAVGRALLNLTDNGATISTNGIYSGYVVHFGALLRKIMISHPGYGSTSTTLQQNCVASQWDSVQVLAPMAQLINEVGPVVLEGQLVCPAYWILNAQAAWFTNWSTIGSTGSQGFPHIYHIVGATTAISWVTRNGGASNTLAGAWVTAYTAAANLYLFTPYYSMNIYVKLFMQLVASGVAYGKGDFLFPCSRGPRGGLCMFSRATYNGANWTNDTWVAGYALTSNALEAFGSHVALSGADITLAAILRPFRIAAAAVQQFKYLKVPNYVGPNEFLDRYIIDTLSPGGAFIDALSKEMEKMHGSTDGAMGIMLPRDNMDICLWGAIKGIAGTIAQAVQPSVSAAASIGCGAVPVAGQLLGPMCKSAAKSLMTYVADTARVSTNRTEHMPVSKALDKFDKIVQESKREARTMAPEERRVIKPNGVTKTTKTKKNGKVKVSKSMSSGKGKQKVAPKARKASSPARKKK